jgi:glutamyl-tRNA synthetase
MHLGNARTALLAWLSARQAGGQVVLRIEDLDAPRLVPGAEARLIEELKWLGLDWDEGPDRPGGPFAPYRQSERAQLYDAAVATLIERGHAFLCACSRADVARAASAPHAHAPTRTSASDGTATHPGGDSLRYPGTCIDLDPDDVRARAGAAGRTPAVRFRGRGARIAFHDGVLGGIDPLDGAAVDDFVLRRGDGVAAYQLAVVVDDAAMRITEVVRGDDLLSSTPRQIALYRALGAVEPAFAHVPLVLSAEGERLAKRTRPRSIGDLRRRGVRPETIVGALATSAGLCEAGSAMHPADLVSSFSWSRLARGPVVIGDPE